MHTQPNGWLHLLADHAVTFAVFPIAADRTLMRTTWLVDEDAEEGSTTTSPTSLTCGARPTSRTPRCAHAHTRG